jgi:hypothetical protein
VRVMTKKVLYYCDHCKTMFLRYPGWPLSERHLHRPTDPQGQWERVCPGKPTKEIPDVLQSAYTLGGPPGLHALGVAFDKLLI